MKQAFEKKVDRKDSIIRSLAKDLDEAEEQYQVALRTHIHKVTELTGTNKSNTFKGIMQSLLLL